jgi:carboxylate-amine ligase
MPDRLVFQASKPLTLGVELELQILDTDRHDLCRGAQGLLGLAASSPHPGDLKPEITESMIEVSTAVVHAGFAGLEAELLEIRDCLAGFARRLDLALAGGGTHPFQDWTQRRIFPAERYHRISDLYGYLAKQFTVFGQHIHIGCADGDDAVYLTRALGRYVPHFIALSASSPFQQGVDSGFDSSRLNAVSAFPLSGAMPPLDDWKAFCSYFSEMVELEIVTSMKDFYWDIRPKPEYGTVELRVPDTPLTVERASQLAALAQTLASYLFERRQPASPRAADEVRCYNRFLACRFGLEAQVIDAEARQARSLQQEVVELLDGLMPLGCRLGTEEALRCLRADAAAGMNDSRRLRSEWKRSGSLQELARWQARMWMGDPEESPP